jgi:hypothetical protein
LCLQLLQLQLKLLLHLRHLHGLQLLLLQLLLHHVERRQRRRRRIVGALLGWPARHHRHVSGILVLLHRQIALPRLFSRRGLG